MNIGFFIGNLTKDPETKAMSNGKPRTTFTLAVQREYLNQNGKRDADFIQLIAFEKNSEIAEKYLRKGRKIEVTYHVKTGSYEKNGQRVFTTEFIVDKMEFLSAANTGATESSAPPQQEEYQPPQQSGFMPVETEELPF